MRAAANGGSLFEIFPSEAQALEIFPSEAQAPSPMPTGLCQGLVGESGKRLCQGMSCPSPVAESEA